MSDYREQLRKAKAQAQKPEEPKPAPLPPAEPPELVEARNRVDEIYQSLSPRRKLEDLKIQFWHGKGEITESDPMGEIIVEDLSRNRSEVLSIVRFCTISYTKPVKEVPVYEKEVKKRFGLNRGDVGWGGLREGPANTDQYADSKWGIGRYKELVDVQTGSYTQYATSSEWEGVAIYMPMSSVGKGIYSEVYTVGGSGGGLMSVGDPTIDRELAENQVDAIGTYSDIVGTHPYSLGYNFRYGSVSTEALSALADAHIVQRLMLSEKSGLFPFSDRFSLSEPRAR